MATRRTSRLSKFALDAIIASKASYQSSPQLFTERGLLGSASTLGNARNSHSKTRISDRIAQSNVACSKFLANTLTLKFHSSNPSYYSASTSSQVKQTEFTEMASWEGIIVAVDAARVSKQQVVESEHLMKALLEQKDGLAWRIFSKAGLDNTSVLQARDDFISQQPKVIGDTSGPIIGSHLNSLLDNARRNKKDMGDDFVSVEHFLLAFYSDKRFGQ
ncbi:Chaperone protein [Quillaja saponaria]|uniref:Chaperone protein n=1 Tax=Quillaja saponaria TaxID=32244 RepID=A0AAD7PK30_QUISA|nr:Chaperone protein [Quillaja saponaria]